ncbi:putative transcription factor interactor and regulator CCHC(Zn) family [Helianthus anomalus]
MYVTVYLKGCVGRLVPFQMAVTPAKTQPPAQLFLFHMYISLLPGTYLGTKTINCSLVLSIPLSSIHYQFVCYHGTKPNLYDVSAANQSDGYHNGIRAPGYSDLRATSTTFPCQHCADERRERKWLMKRCYYYNNPGHQISNCKKKEDDEESQLIRLAINTGVQ